LEVILPPPLWQRWWMQLSVALLAVAAARALHLTRVRRAVEMERVRMRIATDLHDDLGAGLSDMAVLSEVALRAGADERSDILERIAQRSREMLDSTAEIVWMISPTKDNLHELITRVRQSGERWLEPHRIAFTLEAPVARGEVRIDPDARRQFFYVFKEAITNVIRHSGATAVQARILVPARGRLVLEVADNGKGCDPARPAAVGRNGVAGMRWRAEVLGGDLSFSAGEGGGIKVRLEADVGPRRRWGGRVR
jgi:signal transduction histidine kinase